MLLLLYEVPATIKKIPSSEVTLCSFSNILYKLFPRYFFCLFLK